MDKFKSKIVQQILVSYEQNDYQQTLELSRLLLHAGRRHQSLYSIASHCAFHLGMPKLACIYMRCSLRMKWDTGRACELSRMYLSRSRHDLAIRIAKMAARRDPVNMEPHLVLGEVYSDVGDITKAMLAFSFAETDLDLWERAQEEMHLAISSLDDNESSKYVDSFIAKLRARTDLIQSPWLLGLIAIHAKQGGMIQDYKYYASKSLSCAKSSQRYVLAKIFSDL